MAEIETLIERSRWLLGLQPGDTVVVSDGWNPRVARVDRVTDKQVVVGDTRYWKDGGRSVGSAGSWRRPRLVRPTEELVAEIQLKNDRLYLTDMKWGEVSPQKIGQILAILRNSGE
jgi:hypothetical protein